MKKLWILLLVLASPFLIAATPSQEISIPTLTEFLTWLIAGGSVVAISWIFEEIDWFQSLTPIKRRWLMYSLSTLLALVALWITTSVPAEVLATLEPYFAVIAGVFILVIVNQAAHKLNK